MMAFAVPPLVRSSIVRSSVVALHPLQLPNAARAPSACADRIGKAGRLTTSAFAAPALSLMIQSTSTFEYTCAADAS